MKKMTNINHLFTLFVIIVAYGCADIEDKIINPDENIGLVTDSVKTLNINDFNVELSRKGLILNGVWNPGIPVQVLSIAGLWIGMENNGESRGSIVTTKDLPYSNYSSKWGDKQLGVFSLNASSKYLPESWPVSYGAPIDDSGLPKVYGDGMCWTSLQSDTTMKNQPIFSKSINGLRVTHAIYGYKRDDLRNVIFIKYGITNLSTENWNNVYVGFYSDTDLYDAYRNRTGYDLARSISFTYDTTISYVTGFSFVQTPKNVGIKSHRIMRKNNYINPEFGEYSFTTPEQIILALKGLSNYGQPMINPVTSLVTNFAFTGDPVSHTGWLDSPVDVRSMISTELFSLNSGETTWVTLVWVINSGTSLENSLNKLKSKIDQVRSDISLWQFH
jgi:hypothetical protein